MSEFNGSCKVSFQDAKDTLDLFAQEIKSKVSKGEDNLLLGEAMLLLEQVPGEEGNGHQRWSLVAMVRGNAKTNKEKVASLDQTFKNLPIRYLFKEYQA